MNLENLWSFTRSLDFAPGAEEGFQILYSTN